jgi:hypothetical protein
VSQLAGGSDRRDHESKYNRSLFHVVFFLLPNESGGHMVMAMQTEDLGALKVFGFQNKPVADFRSAVWEVLQGMTPDLHVT